MTTGATRRESVSLLDGIFGQIFDDGPMGSAKAQLVADRDRLQKRSGAIRDEIKQLENRLRYLRASHRAAIGGLASLQSEIVAIDAEEAAASDPA